MIIGVPKEIKEGEKRVGMIPQGVDALVAHGHRVLVEKGAGEGSGFSDEEYREAGATLVQREEDVWAEAEMVVKVKEPLEPEIPLMRPGQILFTYLHLAADRGLTLKLMERRIVAIGYETVQVQDGSLPLLRPMSEIAGRASVLAGGMCLEARCGGRGVLLCGASGVPAGESGHPRSRRGRRQCLQGCVGNRRSCKHPRRSTRKIELFSRHYPRTHYHVHLESNDHQRRARGCRSCHRCRVYPGGSCPETGDPPDAEEDAARIRPRGHFRGSGWMF